MVNKVVVRFTYNTPFQVWHPKVLRTKRSSCMNAKPSRTTAHCMQDWLRDEAPERMVYIYERVPSGTSAYRRVRTSGFADEGPPPTTVICEFKPPPIVYKADGVVSHFPLSLPPRFRHGLPRRHLKLTPGHRRSNSRLNRASVQARRCRSHSDNYSIPSRDR